MQFLIGHAGLIIKGPPFVSFSNLPTKRETVRCKRVPPTRSTQVNCLPADSGATAALTAGLGNTRGLGHWNVHHSTQSMTGSKKRSPVYVDGNLVTDLSRQISHCEDRSVTVRTDQSL